MSALALLLILISCVMHAGWNLVCKSKTPSAAFFVLSTGGSVFLMTPLYVYFIPRCGEVAPAVWGVLIATTVFQTGYFISLGNAYRLNDISLSYPLVRSLPVLLIPLTCYLIGYGKPISPLSLAGMGIVAVGCMILPLTRFTRAVFRQYWQYPLLFVLLAAVAITGYSIIDSKGMELLRGGPTPFSTVEAALFYISFQTAGIWLCLWLYVCCSRRETAHLRSIWKGSLRYPLMAGPATTVAYTLVLIAMPFATNVSYIMAFRQISILIGVYLGVAILKEKLTRLKMASTLLIFTGLVLAALG